MSLMAFENHLSEPSNQVLHDWCHQVGSIENLPTGLDCLKCSGMGLRKRRPTRMCLKSLHPVPLLQSWIDKILEHCDPAVCGFEVILIVEHSLHRIVAMRSPNRRDHGQIGNCWQRRLTSYICRRLLESLKHPSDPLVVRGAIDRNAHVRQDPLDLHAIAGADERFDWSECRRIHVSQS